jgi:hypothetical protein
LSTADDGDYLHELTYGISGSQHHSLFASGADAHVPPMSELSHSLMTPVAEHGPEAIVNWMEAAMANPNNCEKQSIRTDLWIKPRCSSKAYAIGR